MVGWKSHFDRRSGRSPSPYVVPIWGVTGRSVRPEGRSCRGRTSERVGGPSCAFSGSFPVSVPLLSRPLYLCPYRFPFIFVVLASPFFVPTSDEILSTELISTCPGSGVTTQDRRHVPFEIARVRTRSSTRSKAQYRSDRHPHPSNTLPLRSGEVHG